MSARPSLQLILDLITGGGLLVILFLLGFFRRRIRNGFRQVAVLILEFEIREALSRAGVLARIADRLELMRQADNSEIRSELDRLERVLHQLAQTTATPFGKCLRQLCHKQNIMDDVLADKTNMTLSQICDLRVGNIRPESRLVDAIIAAIDLSSQDAVKLRRAAKETLRLGSSRSNLARRRRS
jgi:hypothetical protein